MHSTALVVIRQTNHRAGANTWMRPDGRFAQQYAGHATVRICCGVFASLGLIMWIPDIVGYGYRVSPDEDVRVEGRSFAAKMTAAVVMLEDV